MDLFIARIEDMMAELERRGFSAALYVSQTKGRQIVPSYDCLPEDRENVYTTANVGSHPAFKASFLCQGVQKLLNDIAEMR